MDREHFRKLGQSRSEAKARAARENGANGGGRKARPCPRCRSEAKKIVRRFGSKVKRVCYNCERATLSPDEWYSRWRSYYPEKWKSIRVNSRLLTLFTKDELKTTVQKVYQNSPDEQAALDAACVYQSGLSPDSILPKRIRVGKLAERWKELL